MVDSLITHLRPMQLTPERGITLVHGEGSIVEDSEGREYIDCVTGYGVGILGHRHPAVTDAIHTQADALMVAHQSFDTRPRAAAIDALSRVLPQSLTQICFSNSGAESVEAALKFARAATGRQSIVATHRAYHGRTYGALSVTAETRYRQPFGAMCPGAIHVAYDDLEAARQSMKDDVAAVIVEPIQGEAGVRVPRPGYLAGLRKLCDEHGALLIVDEVQTAFRTGAVFAIDHDGVVPDILCLAKGLANGVPIGATITTDAIAAHVPVGSHGSTFAANPLACAAAAATVSALNQPALHAQVTSRGDAFMARIRALNDPSIRDVRGQGLMVGVEFRRSATATLRRLQDRGVLALPAGSTVIRFLPSVLISESQLDSVADILGSTLDD